MPNIILKYEEVTGLLIGERGSLVLDFVDEKRPLLLHCMSELLSLWGNCKGSEDFLNSFLFYGARKPEADDMVNKDWVPQFRLHAELVPAFAADVAAHMQQDEDYGLGEFDSALQSFFDDCGSGVFDITSLRQWLELMSVTGLLHGCTFSMTRLTFTEQNIWSMAAGTEDTFTPLMVENISAAFGTLIGLVQDREVFTDSNLEADPALMSVIATHKDKSERLKRAYKDSWDMKGDTFKKFGWLITDYFPDLFDAKQLTITTYI